MTPRPTCTPPDPCSGDAHERFGFLSKLALDFLRNAQLGCEGDFSAWTAKGRRDEGVHDDPLGPGQHRDVQGTRNWLAKPDQRCSAQGRRALSQSGVPARKVVLCSPKVIRADTRSLDPEGPQVGHSTYLTYGDDVAASERQRRLGTSRALDDPQELRRNS